MHAQSSENLTKNLIMRSQESIDSASRVPEIKNRANYARKKQISEVVQPTPQFDLASKGAPGSSNFRRKAANKGSRESCGSQVSGFNSKILGTKPL